MKSSDFVLVINNFYGNDRSVSVKKIEVIHRNKCVFKGNLRQNAGLKIHLGGLTHHIRNKVRRLSVYNSTRPQNGRLEHLIIENGSDHNLPRVNSSDNVIKTKRKNSDVYIKGFNNKKIKIEPVKHFIKIKELRDKKGKTSSQITLSTKPSIISKVDYKITFKNTPQKQKQHIFSTSRKCNNDIKFTSFLSIYYFFIA